MEALLLVVHLMLVVALVASVLIQRNEGGLGGLGGGSGGGGAGGMGGFLSGRSQANLLTRTTAFLALAFFVTSLALAYIGSNAGGGKKILVPESPLNAPASVPAEPTKPIEPAAPTGQ